MSYPYRIDPAQQLARIPLVGSVRGDMIAETIVAIYQNPQWRPGFALLWDALQITELLLEQPDQASFAELHRRHVDRRPRVEVILVRRDLDRVMAEMYALRMKGAAHPVRIFTTEDEARSILSGP